MDGTVIDTVKRVAELSWTPKAKGKHLSAYRLHTHFEVLSGKALRIDATSASPKGDADERAVLQRTIEADRCYILDRGSISERLWNAINAAGSSYVCRSSDRTLATVTHVNDLTDADRAANVISDEIVDLGWKAKHRTRPDHPVQIQVSFAMIVCMLILLSTGEKPNRAMVQMVWYELIGLASLKELEAFIKTRK